MVNTRLIDLNADFLIITNPDGFKDTTKKINGQQQQQLSALMTT